MFSLNMCRICEKQSHLIDLSLHPNYIKQYLIVGNVSYDANDGLPQFICRFCITQLLHFLKFKQKCEATCQKFKNLLLMQTNQEIKIKTEPLNDNNFYQNDSFYVIDKSEYMVTEATINDNDLQATTESNEYDGNISLSPVITDNLAYDSVKDITMDSGTKVENQKSNEIIPQSCTKTIQFICDICETKKTIFFESLQKLELHMTAFHRMITNLRQCDQCGNRSKWYTFDKLPKHHFKCHGMSHKCNYCGKCFSKKCLLGYHIRMHTGEKPFKCDYCKTSFSHKRILIEHMVTHTGKKPFKCDYCLKSFSRKHVLVQHIRAHIGVKPYKCDNCEKCFAYKRSLYTHNIKEHAYKPKKTYKCQDCEKFYYAKADLNVHSKMHTGEKPFKCKYCEKCCIRKPDLVKHTRTHTGEKPYKCEYCKKCFAQNNILTNHMLTHTGEKPFKCDYCEKSFSRKHILKDHVIAHSGDKTFKCQFCEKTFLYKQSLMFHKLRTHTNEPEKTLKCQYCQKCYFIKSDFATHLKTHAN